MILQVLDGNIWSEIAKAGLLCLLPCIAAVFLYRDNKAKDKVIDALNNQSRLDNRESIRLCTSIENWLEHTGGELANVETRLASKITAEFDTIKSLIHAEKERLQKGTGSDI